MALATRSQLVPRVQWASHVDWLREHLQPGQHVSIITFTGGGKSHLTTKGLLQLPAIEHARVLMVDDKGDDPTTRSWGIPISEYPPGWGTRRDPEQPEHYRLTVPDWTWSSTGSHETGVRRAREVVGRALDVFYEQARNPDDPSAPDDARASVVVIDELYALSAHRPPSLNLAPLVVRNWRKGRYRALTQIALTQEPAWVPGEMYSQPTHLYIGQILDSRRRDRLKEIGGNTEVITHVVAQLQEHEFLFLGDKGRHMAIVKVGR